MIEIPIGYKTLEDYRKTCELNLKMAKTLGRKDLVEMYELELERIDKEAKNG